MSLLFLVRQTRPGRALRWRERTTEGDGVWRRARCRFERNPRNIPRRRDVEAIRTVNRGRPNFMLRDDAQITARIRPIEISGP